MLIVFKNYFLKPFSKIVKVTAYLFLLFTMLAILHFKKLFFCEICELSYIKNKKNVFQG